MKQPNLPFRAVTARFSLLLALVAAALLLVAACGGSSDSTSTPTAQASSTPSPSPTVAGTGTPTPSPMKTGGSNPRCIDSELGLISALTFDKDTGVYTAGTPITMTLVLTDCASSDSKLVYPTTQRTVFTVSDSNGNVMWSSIDGKTFGQTESTETIASEQDATYVETWDEKDRSGNQVPDGQYKVSAFSVGCIATARTGCEFGPVRFVSIGSATASPGT